MPKRLRLPNIDDPLAYDFFLTSEQLRERWQIGKGKLEGWMRSAKPGPTYIRVGQRYLWPLSEVLEYERGNRHFMTDVAHKRRHKMYQKKLKLALDGKRQFRINRDWWRDRANRWRKQLEAAGIEPEPD